MDLSRGAAILSNMIHVPRQVEYALMVLSLMQMGTPGERFAVRKLSTELAIPFDVTSKAMQAMAREGILQSIQGKQGGYRIAADLRDLTLDQLVTVVAAPPAITPCLQNGKTCNHAPACTIRKAMVRLDAKVRDLFKSVSVYDLVA